MNKPRSILNPIEQPVYGLVQIVVGDRVPNLVLAYIKKKVKERL